MYIYIISFALSLILLWFAQNKVKSKKIKIALMVLAAVPFLIISSIRYDLGTDYTKRYTRDYLKLANEKDVTNLEIGFKLIDYFCLLFTKEPFMLFVLTSLIILTLIFTSIYKEKNTNTMLSVLIFFLGGYFFGSLNLVRQYIAIGFILVGYHFLISENKKKVYIGFSICAILAFLMHSSSIVCFILLFLNKKVLLSAKWVVPVGILILLLNEHIMNVLKNVIEKTRFSVYLSSANAGGEISILNIAENLMVFLWMYSIYYFNKKKVEKFPKQGIFFLNIQALAFLVTVLASAHHLFSRIALYFAVFQIISIPYYIKIMPYNLITEKISKFLNKNFKERSLKIATYILVILCFSTMFTYTNILNNDNEVLPYKTIFDLKHDKI